MADDLPGSVTAEASMSYHIGCNCPACKLGLWCPDGRRGEFVRGEDNCKLCGVTAWKHSTRTPKGARA